MSVITKFVTLLLSEITQFADHFRVRLISQLIKSNSRVFQKVLKYFSGTAIFAFMIPGLLVLP